MIYSNKLLNLPNTYFKHTDSWDYNKAGIDVMMKKTGDGT